jgi:hypothetical protein
MTIGHRNDSYFATLPSMNTFSPRNLGHATEAECLQLISLFIGIDDAAIRQKVLRLLNALATDTGELLTLDELVTFQ